MEGTRDAMQEQRRTARSWPRRIAEWLAYGVLLPRHGLVLALTWLLLVAQRLHLVPRRFSLPRLRARSLATPLRASSSAAVGADAWLFPGCVMDAWQRDVHRAAQRVMEAAGARVVLPGRGGDCCGALHAHAGRVDEARALARRVIASMPGDAPVVVDSAGCGAAMKDYGRLLGTDDAHAFAARVRDFAEWAAEHDVPLRTTGRRIVVQDPCHLRHVQRAAEPTHTLLARAYAVTTTDDDGLCCGAGGAYAVMQPALSREIRDRKVDALCRTGRDGAPLVVASANPGCIMQLRSAGLDVRHPAELLADALAPDEGAG
jgi:glycolate oxidase iron-sulfur subunit